MLLYFIRETNSVNLPFSACDNFVELSRPTLVMHEKKVIILVADHAFFRYYLAISLEEGD
jgi:hypothetical protein